MLLTTNTLYSEKPAEFLGQYFKQPMLILKWKLNTGLNSPCIGYNGISLWLSDINFSPDT